MFFSVLMCRAYTTILASLGTLGFLYGLLPVLIVLFAALNSFTAPPLLLGSYAHPFIAMATQSADLAMPGATRGLSLAWEIHCLVMLALSLGVAALCVPLIRRVSLRMAVGGGMSRAKPQPLPAAPARQPAALAQPLGYDRRLASKSDLIAAGLEPPALPAAHRPPPTPAQAERGIRRVVGPPVLWKETRGPWLFRTTWAKVSFILKLSLLVLVNILFAGLSSHAVASPHYHAAVLAILTGMVVIVVAVTSAATVTAEKETRALPVLLTTPLSNAQIIAGKFVGTLRRLVGPMVPLFGHLLFFVFIGLLAQSGFIRPLAIFHLGLILVPMVCFYNASGLYFSSKFKKTSAAVVANLGLALTLLLLCARGPWHPRSRRSGGTGGDRQSPRASCNRHRSFRVAGTVAGVVRAPVRQISLAHTLAYGRGRACPGFIWHNMPADVDRVDLPGGGSGFLLAGGGEPAEGDLLGETPAAAFGGNPIESDREPLANSHQPLGQQGADLTADPACLMAIG